MRVWKPVRLNFNYFVAVQDKLNQIKAVPGALSKLQDGVAKGLQIARDTLDDIM